MTESSEHIDNKVHGFIREHHLLMEFILIILSLLLLSLILAESAY